MSEIIKEIIIINLTCIFTCIHNENTFKKQLNSAIVLIVGSLCCSVKVGCTL